MKSVVLAQFDCIFLIYEEILSCLAVTAGGHVYICRWLFRAFGWAEC